MRRICRWTMDIAAITTAVNVINAAYGPGWGIAAGVLTMLYGICCFIDGFCSS